MLIRVCRASLRIFTAAGGMEALRQKSLALTGYLEKLLDELEEDVSIITPRDAAARGCQLSLTFKRSPREVYKVLQREGIIIDFREVCCQLMTHAFLFAVPRKAVIE
jgi:kynureninase